MSMNVRVEPTHIPGLVVVEPDVFTDHRGFFYESYSAQALASHGIDLKFVQDNHSRSIKGVVRGLHYQAPGAEQWRLVRCTVGHVFDVVVDIDAGSPTYGQWFGIDLSADNGRQLLIPPAFAHGFTVLSDVAEVQYKITDFHDATRERALRWNDPDVAVEWPTAADPIVSVKDAAAPTFADYRLTPDFPSGWARSTVDTEETNA